MLSGYKRSLNQQDEDKQTSPGSSKRARIDEIYPYLQEELAMHKVINFIFTANKFVIKGLRFFSIIPDMMSEQYFKLFMQTLTVFRVLKSKNIPKDVAIMILAQIKPENLGKMGDEILDKAVNYIPLSKRVKKEESVVSAPENRAKFITQYKLTKKQL